MERRILNSTTKDESGKRIWTDNSYQILAGGDHVEIFDLCVASLLEIGFTQHSYARYTLDKIEVQLYNNSVGVFNLETEFSLVVRYREAGMNDFWEIVRRVWSL